MIQSMVGISRFVSVFIIYLHYRVYMCTILLHGILCLGFSEPDGNRSISDIQSINLDFESPEGSPLQNRVSLTVWTSILKCFDFNSPQNNVVLVVKHLLDIFFCVNHHCKIGRYILLKVFVAWKYCFNLTADKQWRICSSKTKLCCISEKGQWGGDCRISEENARYIWMCG